MLHSRSLSMMPVSRARVCDIDHIAFTSYVERRAGSARARAEVDAPAALSGLVCKGSRAMGKRRLDTLLAERGLFPSRSRAAASVMAGEVRVGPGDRRASKPSELVDVEERLSVRAQPAVRLARRYQAGKRARRIRSRRRGQARARRRRLDRRLHRLPAAARRARGDRGGRRLRDPRLSPAKRRARDGDSSARMPAR